MTAGNRVRVAGPPSVYPAPRDGTVTKDTGGLCVLVTFDDGYRGPVRRSALTEIPNTANGALRRPVRP
jgi:hypothetical protein